MKAPANKSTAVVLVALGVAGLVFALEALGAFEALKYKAYDGLFYLRARVASPPPAGPVVLVAIDDATFDDPAFKIPQILWHNYLAAVIQGLADAQAKVVVLDYLLPQASFDNLVKDYTRTWLKAFVYARSKGTRVVSGFMQLGNKLVRPESRFVQILESANLGLFNLTSDGDDFIRRQKLEWALEGQGARMKSVPLLAAQAYNPFLKPPAETVYIDFSSAEPPFPTFSLSEVYRRARLEEIGWLNQRFGGKIVLIGTTDSLSQDRHPTPRYHLLSSGHKRDPGVTIIGQTVSTLLAGRYVRELAWPLKLTLYLLLALGAAALAVFGRRWWIAVSLPALILVYESAVFVFFANYLLLPAVAGAAALGFSQMGAFIYRYLSLDKEERRVKAVFQRFLPSRVVNRLLASRDEEFYKGESRRLTILFSDIRGFTTYSEGKPPAVVVGRLNEYFEAMSNVVSRHGGVVDKYLGDGLMAFFGAFDQASSPSLDGARAALGMLEELERLNLKWSALGQPTFAIGVGLHTGTVMIGNIGSRIKTEYTVIGDPVNLASRLQDKTKDFHRPIIISQEVYNDLAGLIEAEDLGEAEIKGHSGARIYALKDIRGKA